MFFARAPERAHRSKERQRQRYSAGSRRVARVLVLALLLGTVLSVSALTAAPAHAASTPLSTSACLARSSTTTISGTQSSQVKVSSPGADKTFDARNATFTAYPTKSLYPWSLGSSSPGVRMCVIGGKVVGQQSRNLTWDQMKNSYDGDGLRVAGNDWYVIDGLRVDNVEDGVSPRGTDGRYPKDGDGFEIRNAYMTYIRDDCVENDDVAGGVIRDSLFDGCNTGISERPDKSSPQNNHPAPSGETLTLDHVLLRLQAMPGPRGYPSSVLGHGQLFKWSSVANKLVIRDSIFLVERKPNGGSADFPSGTVASNVTVVWLGGGSYPGKVPSGVKVISNRSVWDSARAKWLQRHGCSSFDVCTKLHSPDPYDASTSEPPATAPAPAPEPPAPAPAPESPAPAPVTLSLGAAADASIYKGSPGKNTGASALLRADGSPQTDALLKFVVSGVGSRTVKRAKLVLRCVDSSTGGGTFYATGSGWTETGVTWSNAPSRGAAVATLGPVASGKAYEVDVTKYVTGDGTFSLRLAWWSANAALFGSRQNTTASLQPRLVIEAG